MENDTAPTPSLHLLNCTCGVNIGDTRTGLCIKHTQCIDCCPNLDTCAHVRANHWNIPLYNVTCHQCKRDGRKGHTYQDPSPSTRAMYCVCGCCLTVSKVIA